MAKILSKQNSKFILKPYACEVIEKEMTRTYILIMEPISANLKQFALQKTMEASGLSDDELRDLFVGVA